MYGISSNEIIIKILICDRSVSWIMEAIAIFFISLIFMIPFILLPLGIFVFDWSARMITLYIVQILLIFFIKVVCAIRFKERIQDIFLHPFLLHT